MNSLQSARGWRRNVHVGCSVALIAGVLALGLFPNAARADDEAQPTAEDAAPRLAFRVAKVVSMDERDRVINNATVLVENGKIARVGPTDEVEIPEGFRTIDMPECWLTPGLVDAHNHTAGGLGDLNDMVYLTNPGLDTRSTIQANNDLIKQARTGGVTTVLLIPGSGTNISGFGTVAKTAGESPDEAIVRSPGSLKIAQAGNPEWYFGGVNRRFMNWNTRRTLEKARDYHLQWEKYEGGETQEKPEFNPVFDQFRGLFRREFPISVHTQWYQVLLTTVKQLTVEMNLWTVLDHCTFNAWKVGPIVRETDAWTINGPREYEFDRTARRMIGNASGWWKNGVHKLGINTDAPVVPEKELSYQAAMACWYGWLPYPALRGVTALPAQALGIYNRTGSIEAQKDADFGIWTGNPIDPRSACLMTIVNGRIAYDGTKESERLF